ncbi:major tail protein [Lysinibacillus sp. NPDC086135]|uniref:major tail protein n=1 Tax=Lysinibacillus sp. NPDC086135 TaxID=3364130 RepID=UPI0038051AF8
MTKNSVLFGLTNVHYATFERDPDGSYKYDTPVRIEGGVSLTLNPVGDEAKFYADNGVYFSRFANNGYEGTLNIAMITDKLRTEVLGEKMVNGGFLETADARPKDVALMFEVDGDATQTRFVYYNCAVARPTQTANTVAESIEIEGQELTFTAKPRLNDKAIRWNTGDATEATIYDNFFKAVVQPEAIPPVVDPGEDKKAKQ